MHLFIQSWHLAHDTLFTEMSSTVKSNKATIQSLTDGLEIGLSPCNDVMYKVLNDATRNVQVPNKWHCDDSEGGSPSPDWHGPNWYRFEYPAGKRMPQHVVDKRHCGTLASGWLNGTHPTNIGQSVDRIVCFHWSSNTCYEQSLIKIRNCGHFFLYYLPNVPACNNRYCGTT